MKKLLTIYLTISLLALTSCSNSMPYDTKNINKENTDSMPSMKIYHMDYDLQLKDAISLFNTSNNQVKIMATEFKNLEEYKNQIATDTLAGEGPDIFVGYDFFASIRKAISSGVFCDLNPWIGKDESFKLSEYNMNILDCGVIDGKRYIFPIDYPCDGFYTTKELLSENNISIDDSNWTWKEFAETAKLFAEKNKGKDKYLVGWNFDFKAIMTNCGVSFIDYDNKKANFNSSEFIELLQAYKDMYPAICTDEILATKKPDPFQLLDDSTILLIYDKLEPHRLYQRNAIIKNAMNSQTQILSLPTYKAGSVILARLSNFAAINSECKYKEQAFEFIKMVLSKENRRTGFNFGIPTNKIILRDEMKFYLKSDLSNMNKISFGKYTTNPINITQDIFDRIQNMAGRINIMVIIDSSIFKIINSELPDLLNERKTAQQIAKQINERVTIFLNE